MTGGQFRSSPTLVPPGRRCFLTTEDMAALFTEAVGSAELSGARPRPPTRSTGRSFWVLLQAAAGAAGTFSNLSQRLNEVTSDHRARIIDQRLAA
jgi:hypothetical protein